MSVDELQKSVDPQIPELCGAGSCHNTIGSFVCQCPDGYSVKPEQGPACTDDDECELGTCDCHPAADCINLPVSDLHSAPSRQGCDRNVKQLVVLSSGLVPVPVSGWVAWGRRHVRGRRRVPHQQRRLPPAGHLRQHGRLLPLPLRHRLQGRRVRAPNDLLCVCARVHMQSVVTHTRGAGTRAWTSTSAPTTPRCARTGTAATRRAATSATATWASRAPPTDARVWVTDALCSRAALPMCLEIFQ